MSQTPDIHDQEQRLKWNQKKFSNSEHVCDPNKELVKQFCDKCFAEGLSDARVKKYITNFHTIFKLSQGIDFVLDEADRETLEKVVARIERSDYAEATKSDFKACLKKYYKVMEGEGFQYPDKVKFFSQTRDSSKMEKPDPLSKKQVMRILDETQNDRDLALYHLLYEGALRPQEILSLSISDLSWTSQGVRVNINGKTGNRQILVVECKDHLRRWMERHPLADKRNAPLWTDLNVDSDKKMEKLRMNYDYFRIKLKRLSKKAGVRTLPREGKEEDGSIPLSIQTYTTY